MSSLDCAHDKKNLCWFTNNSLYEHFAWWAKQVLHWIIINFFKSIYLPRRLHQIEFCIVRFSISAWTVLFGFISCLFSLILSFRYDCHVIIIVQKCKCLWPILWTIFDCKLSCKYDASSVTRLGDLLNLGQVFKAFGTN